MPNAVPVGIENGFLPFGLFTGLLEAFDPRTSLYKALAENYGVRMLAAAEVVEAGLASTEEARLLNIGKNIPVLFLTRVSYAENGQPIEYVRSTYRGDRWKLVSRLTASPDTQMRVRLDVNRRSLPIQDEKVDFGVQEHLPGEGLRQRFGEPGGFMNRRAVFYLVLIVAFTAGFLSAQEITGDIRGVVRDASGALVTGAKISVNNTDRNATIRTLTTGTDGSYVAPYLPVGHYQIIVEVSGFKKYIGNDIVLNVSDHRIVDVQLQVGGANETVTVQEYGLHARRVAKRPSTPKAPTASLPPLPLRLLPGGANQFPGGSCTR